MRLLVVTASHVEAHAAQELYSVLGLKGLGEKVEVCCSGDTLTFTSRLDSGSVYPTGRRIPVPYGFTGLLAEIETPRKELVIVGLPSASSGAADAD